MTKYDPEAFLHLLRDHLAAHDRRLIFLFGAGTSSSVNVAPPPTPGDPVVHKPLIPGIWGMTSTCESDVAALSSAHAAAWATLVADLKALGVEPTIERILGRVRMKVEALSPGETDVGLSLTELEEFENRVRQTIVELASPGAIPARLPHDDFARWVRHARRIHPVEVFTTNYDILLERSFEDARVPYFDGFVGGHRPFFDPLAIESAAAAPGPDWLRLWKLHGSINWTSLDGVPTRTSGVSGGEMILPSHLKYAESRKMPYQALMDRLATVMRTENTLLISCGYSWGDEHVNATILTGLESNPSSAAIALMHDDVAHGSLLAVAAEGHDNLLVAGPQEAILRTRRGGWQLGEPPDRATASGLDLAFDSDALKEDAEGPVTGRLRLGDFAVLSRFLAGLAPTALPR